MMNKKFIIEAFVTQNNSGGRGGGGQKSDPGYISRYSESLMIITHTLILEYILNWTVRTQRYLPL